MEKYLPILRNSSFFKGLTDEEILSILHCVEATTVSKERDHAADVGIDRGSRKTFEGEKSFIVSYSIRMWDQRRGKEAL